MKNNYLKNWALDISTKPLSVAEVTDAKDIVQSIENILLTIPGERIMDPYFGSELNEYLGRGLTYSSGEALLDSLIMSIQKYERRVKVLPNSCSIRIYESSNCLDLSIVYIINADQTPASFNKRIYY